MKSPISIYNQLKKPLKFGNANVFEKNLAFIFFGFLKQGCHKRKVDDATKYRVIYEKASLALEL